MKEDDAVQEELNKAKDKSRHLERQLHDKDRELKGILLELNDAHTSNRQLQVRIDELREEMNIYMPTTPGTALRHTQFDFSFTDTNENSLQPSPIQSSNGSDSNSEIPVDIQSNLMINDMSSELTLRCYKSLVNTVSNCHQHLFELKQEMWEVYQHLQLVNSILRNYVKNQDSESKKNETENEMDDIPSPGPLNLSNALTDLSGLVQKVTTVKDETVSEDQIIKDLKKKLETLVNERDEALSSKQFLEVTLTNAKTDLKSVNNQLLRTIQQKLAHQKELEAWQEDMEEMVQRSVVESRGFRRVNSLHQNKESNRPPTSNRRSMMVSSGRNGEGPSSSIIANPAMQSEHADKSVGFFTSWLRKKLTQSSVLSSPTKKQNV